jgi:hypothetical protein
MASNIVGLFGKKRTYQKLATLSTASFITNGDKLALRLYAYFERSSYKQSTMYDGYVASLPLLIHLYNDNLIKMREETIKMLTEMYERYFTDVELEVTFDKDVNELYFMTVIGTMKDNERTVRLDSRTNLGKQFTGYSGGA